MPKERRIEIRGDRVESLRFERGLTTEELARKANLPFGLVLQITIGGVKDLPANEIVALARALDVTMARLLGNEPGPITRGTVKELNVQRGAFSIELEDTSYVFGEIFHNIAYLGPGDVLVGDFGNSGGKTVYNETRRQDVRIFIRGRSTVREELSFCDWS